ncbi:MAG: hypothetical protein QXG39_10040 [Candidatus Aenigmatarchaeota archaeon]
MEQEFSKIATERGFFEVPLEKFSELGRKLDVSELDGKIVVIENIDLRQSSFNPAQQYIIASGRLQGEKVYITTASRQVVNVLTKASKFAPLLVQFQVLKVRGRTVLRIRNIAVANPPK